ncbi:MAG TPA: glycosyltransferase, partial [Anaerolineae bacterium]|nr:glycosyltransferase [Anaerolineae bacterium]
MMRVVMVGPFGFHPNKTMRSRALPLARGLVARGHEVLVVMPPWQTPAEGGRRWVEDGVSVSYVTLGGGIVGITRRLVGGVRAWEPDIVHCFKPKAYSGLVSWWLWQRGWRQGLVMDTDDWEGWGGWNERADYSWSQKHFFAWQERWGLTHCSGVTVASRHLETLVWGLGVAREKVAYVPNGSGLRWPVAEASGLRAELGWEKRPILLLYSRLFEFDVSRLTRILERVREQVPDLAILSIGTGLFAEEAAQLREEWQVAGLLESVHDLGWVEEQLLPGVLAVADVGIYLMDDTLLNRTKCPVKLAD